MRVFRREDQRTIPWKNGGGVTTELMVWPVGASLDTFELRISRAKVEKDGPFSIFAGVDRSLLVLEGEGMTLDVEGTRVTLRPGDAPFVFAGERAIEATLLSGPLTDFNVMTRRTALRHELSWARVEGEAMLSPRGSSLVLAVIEGALGELRAGDAAEVDRTTTLRGDARLLRVDLFAA